MGQGYGVDIGTASPKMEYWLTVLVLCKHSVCLTYIISAGAVRCSETITI